VVEKLLHQINVRTSGELFADLEEISRKERRPLGEIVRMALEWIVPELKNYGSVRVLTRHRPRKGYSRRVSEELQDELHAALDLIFERAPSTVVDRVAEYLTERAGKYGEEK
jgi:predicted DNA-binding protein